MIELLGTPKLKSSSETNSRNLPTSLTTALQFGKSSCRKIRDWDGLTEYQIVYRMSALDKNASLVFTGGEQHLKMTETTLLRTLFSPTLTIHRRDVFKLPERRPKMGDVLVRMIEAHKVACKEERTSKLSE